MRLPRQLYVYNDITTFLVNSAQLFRYLIDGAALLGTIVAAVAGTSVAVSNSSSIPSLSLAELPFSLRLVVFILVASALGWGLGAIVAHFSRSDKDGLRLICLVVGACWGGLLIGTAQWAGVNAKGPFPELMFLTLVGLGIVFRLSTFQFRASAGPARSTTTRCRCDAVLAFAVSTVFLLLLIEFAGA